MGEAEAVAVGGASAPPKPLTGGAWLFSLPLLSGVLTYLYLLGNARYLLRDGDTYWHIAAGRWILEHAAVPDADPFSHSLPGAPWIAHEWGAEVLLALAREWGGWELVVAVASFALACAIALLARALLRHLEPIYAILFAGLAVFMAAGHALARPHLLAMPLMMVWTVELVHAADERRPPTPWVLPVMVLWANLHAGFMVGLAFAVAMGAEVVMAARAGGGSWAAPARSWGLFLLLAVACAMLTPHGPWGFWYMWLVLARSTYVLGFIGEWQSPNFHVFQPLALWLLGGMALALHQGLRLPAIRLVLLLGLVYVSLKHARNIELLGLLGPLLVAAPFGQQWRERRANTPQWAAADGFLLRLSRRAGCGALLLAAIGCIAIQWRLSGARLLEPAAVITPRLAVKAAQAAGLHGGVLNQYEWGGYLIDLGLPVFIDGRGEMYGDEFVKTYRDALGLASPQALTRLVERYDVRWTLLQPGTPAIALLDRLPGWRRLHADDSAVVHVREMPAKTGR